MIFEVSDDMAINLDQVTHVRLYGEGLVEESRVDVWMVGPTHCLSFDARATKGRWASPSQLYAAILEEMKR